MTPANGKGGSAEKQGNTSWVQCPDCQTWFPVSIALLDSPDVSMHCPGCHREFAAGEAGRIVRAGP